MASEWWEWNGDLAKDIHDSLKIKVSVFAYSSL